MTTSAIGMRTSTGPVGRVRRAGFTLVELILVMVLTLTVLAMAAPRLDRFSRRRVLVSNAEAVLALLETARDRAAAEAVAYRVRIDSGAASCRLLQQSGGTYQPPAGPAGRVLRLPSGVGISLTQPDGSAADALRSEPTDDRPRRGDGGEVWFVEFSPAGECTPARVRLQDDDRGSVTLLCRSPIERFAIVGDPEEAGT